MSKYCGFAYARHSLDYLRALPKQARRIIVRAVTKLAFNPYPSEAVLVLGRLETEGERVYRIHVSDFRILYSVREDIVIVLDIASREDYEETGH